MNRFLKEPTVHFVLMGGALFLIFELVSPDGAAGGARLIDSQRDHRILVTESLLSGLSQDYLRRTGNPPTDEVLQGLIEQYVDDEVLVREARTLGLDRGDPVVRRRLLQRMAFVIEDGSWAEPPSDAELSDFVARHPERYWQPARITFEHIFVAEPGPNGQGTPRDRVEQLVERLAAGDDPAQLGDPFIAGRRFAGRTEAQVSATFGPDFAARVMGLPEGEWRGPIASSFGHHLVRVERRQAGGPPELGAVRSAATRDWWTERRRRAQREAITRLRAAYVVEVEDGARDGSWVAGPSAEAAVSSGDRDGVAGVASWARREAAR